MTCGSVATKGKRRASAYGNRGDWRAGARANEVVEIIDCPSERSRGQQVASPWAGEGGGGYVAYAGSIGKPPRSLTRKVYAEANTIPLTNGLRRR